MSDKLIWQSDSNPIEVVYDSIYGMPIEKCMETLKNYHDGKFVPIEWIEKYIWRADTHEEKRALRKMYIVWEKENETN